MKNRVYLLNMSVAGIKSIKEEVRLDFYKKNVDKSFNPEKYRIKAVYGENGSGKSAIITAVTIFQNVTMKSNYLSESKTQLFLDEIVNKATQKFCFRCEFLVEDDADRMVCDYFMQIGKSNNGTYEIQHERLNVKSGNYANNKYRTVVECKNGELVYILCDETEKRKIEQKTMNLLSVHSFIHLYVMKFEKEDTRDMNFLFYMLVCGKFCLSLWVYIEEEDQHELYFWQKKMKDYGFNNQALRDAFFEDQDNVNKFLSVNERFVDKQSFEEYKERVSQLTQFIKIFKRDLVCIDIDAKENGEQYVCDLNMNYGEYVINKEFESTGIKKLIRLFDCFAAASIGGIVFIDEMDSNLNDVYLCKLIEYFMYYGKGQLCFTTHNLDPMSVLKENKNAIDFLSSDNHLVSWVSRGNASPENCYKNGMIEDSPFNIDATDFVGIFGE